MSEPEEKKIQKRKRGIETHKLILEASAELFARSGYHAVPMQEIAKKVGIRESSIYNHFKNKEDILETLFRVFKERAPGCRPSQEELDRMILVMQPEEIFKTILIHFGSHADGLLENIAMVITNEKFRNPLAAETYFKNVVEEPSEYFEKLIRKMIDQGMLGPLDARLFAEQYNYVSIALTKEYFMAKNGLADEMTVLKYMVKTLNFFCDLMKNQKV